MDVKGLLLVMSVTWLVSVDAQRSSISQGKCEKITVPLCTSMHEYNMTSMPNKLGHVTQEEAGLEVHQFYPLVELKCSVYLKFFLCSLYVPICMSNYDQPLPPCRHVCEDARDGCLPLMTKFGFVWPQHLDCGLLPEADDGSGQLCMGPPKEQFAKTSTTTHYPIWKEVTRTTAPVQPPKWTPPSTHHGGESKCDCECWPPYVVVTSPSSSNRWVGNVSHCAHPCYSPYIKDSASIQSFMDSWLGGWSIASCIVSTLTVLTFLIDTQRFRYPERPIFFLAFCCLGTSIGYIIRFGAGHSSASCDSIIVQGGVTQANTCTVVFLFVYYFGMASACWWLVLSFNWFLAAALKWSSEAIDSYARYFHLVAWVTPAIQTVLVMSIGGIDGDVMSGMCYVGNTDTVMMRLFVIGPLCLFLGIGAIFLCAGFMSMIRIRHDMKQQYCAVDKLNRLILKLGLFAILYMLPTLSVVLMLIYEQRAREHQQMTGTCKCAPQPQAQADNELLFLSALTKHAMSLVVGLTTGLWVFSGKSLQSWSYFIKYVFCCGPTAGSRAGSSSQTSTRHNAPLLGMQYTQQQNQLCRTEVTYQPSHDNHNALCVQSHTDVSNANNIPIVYTANNTPHHLMYHGTRTPVQRL